MTAVAIERGLEREPATSDEGMPQGIACSAVLHLVLIVLVVLGLPTLFRSPPPLETPIAVELVTIAPETRATRPNPYKPKAEAKSDTPPAPPAPKPEPKPEPPQPASEPPPAAGAPSQLPPPPTPKPEVKAAPPPPPPPKPVEALTPSPPVPPPPEPKPKPEPRPPVAHAAAAKPEAQKFDPAAFNRLAQNLEHKKPEPATFDSLLKNLTRQETAEAEQMPPQRPRQTASAAPSSQPKAPLGPQLTASDIDLVRERLRPCFNPPIGAKEKPDLTADIRVAMNRDGTVQQARVVDQGQYGSDPVYRAIADSGIRALKNPDCSPLPLPPDRFDVWQSFVFGFSTRDMQ